MSGERSLAVALLAGGRSLRFGSDKAFFVPPGAAEPMWRLQLDKLLALEASEVIVSVGSRSSPTGFSPPTGVRLIPDRHPDQGPLGGLASVLGEIRSERLLVLGIDMPGVTVAALGLLLEACEPGNGRGLVPWLAGRWEPLLAIYPRVMSDVAEQRLARGERSLQGFVEAGVARGMIGSWPVPDACAGWFVNLNRPETS
ncbi:MAG: Molybdopterin-guanine dinucleotide biosynthesis protein A [Verrucomicrobia bacterium]|nr:MAG: Molybdopterin-guanine dinucleotide biosynthesis protein A [Verrucomicrobiota bacterium]